MKLVNEHTKSVFYILIGACSFGFLSSIIKIAYNLNISSSYITFSQFIYGFLLFLAIFLVINNKYDKIKSISFCDFLNLILTGLFSYSTAYLYNETLNYLPASISIVLLFQFTWICILFDIFYLKMMPSKNTFYGLLLLICGTILSSGMIQCEMKYSSIGLILGLMSAFSFALFLFYSKKISLEISPSIKTFFVLLSSSIFAFIVFSISLKGDNIFKYFYLLNTNGIINIYLVYGLILGLFGSLIPTYFITLGTPKLSMGLSSILSSIELPIVVATSYWILKESITHIQVFGVVIILFGIVVTQLEL